MSRTAKIISTAVATAALSLGSLGMASAGVTHVEFSAKNVWCC